MLIRSRIQAEMTSNMSMKLKHILQQVITDLYYNSDINPPNKLLSVQGISGSIPAQTRQGIRNREREREMLFRL